jgi:sigma-B regulation protein RsbU (phosphoserine phosphatase)
VGAFPDVSFALTQRVLAPGDTLFLYTDGVTDALNANGEAFGEDRLLAGLAGLAGTHVNELTRGIVAMVERFADHDEQADDIAVMAVTFQNGAVSEEHESHG